ncbi:Small ribosomal subunit protein uS9 [Candidatus Liberibacter solanacearum]|uniref:30S ribosomal protein S9 n=1 Tax=Candidatus Liberibacter solanacearum TaxID=556287 RepID=UPI0038725878
MIEDITNLKDIIEKEEGITVAKIATEESEDKAISSSPTYSRKVDQWQRSYATGKRKTSIARVWIKSGSGKFTINRMDISKYFKQSLPILNVKRPIKEVSQDDMYDVFATVSGGGFSGQASAICHGISKALTYFQPDLRPQLKKGGFLTRDSRIVERKKYGKAKARRSFQFSKR